MDDCQAVSEKLPEIASELFYIRSQEEGMMLIPPNEEQLRYHYDRLKRGFGSRDLILKARKRGFTTWKVLEALALVLFGPEGVGCAIVVHEERAKDNVFKILRWAYDRLPESIKRDRPLDEDRRDAFAIGGSTCYAYTAGGRGVLRGETIHFAHLSEVAHWPDPEEALPGILDAVPRLGHVCQESTPKGRDNYFYTACRAAQDGESDYKLYFVPWWRGPENALDLRDGERIIPDEEEEVAVRLAQNDGVVLTSEQIKWRRAKLRDPGTAKTFLQEHPEDPETCFLVSGSPLIDPLLLARLVRQAEITLPLEKIWVAGDGEKIVWKRPTGNFPFIVAVDVAEGKATGDWSVISTWQLRPEALTQVARTKIKCNTDDLADLVLREAREYHEALAIVERNSIGALVVKKMTDLGYWNQYYRLDREDQIFETEHPGWNTNRNTKSQMVEEFVAGVNAGDIVSLDSELFGQAMNVSRDDFGRPVFPKKKHDDIFIAACLANMARDQARMRSGGGASVVSYA